MGRRRNWLPLGGFLVTLTAFLSYFFYFAYFPTTRDFPWLNLLLFAAGLVLLGGGLRRAHQRAGLRRFERSPPGPVCLVHLLLLAATAGGGRGPAPGRESPRLLPA